MVAAPNAKLEIPVVNQKVIKFWFSSQILPIANTNQGKVSMIVPILEWVDEGIVSDCGERVRICCPYKKWKIALPSLVFRKLKYSRMIYI